MTRRLVALLLALAASARAAPPVPLGPCGPIARPFDPIELAASRLHRLGAPPIARLGLLAFRGGVPGPIPFQVDERVGSKLALPDGPQPTQDDRPGVFDPDDQLVFMACDAGEQASPEALGHALAGAGTVTAWREIRIDDPYDHRAAFVYLVVAEHPPLTDRRYIDYDPAHDIVSTPRYRVGLVNALPVYFALALAGPLGPNVLDGLRLRAQGTLRAGLATKTLDEQNGHHELVAWKVGPVRVVRRSRHQIYLGLGIYLTAGVAHTYFYAQHVFGPGSLKLPFSPELFFRDISAWGGADFRDLRGWRYHAPGVPAKGFRVDGRMDAAERGFDGTGGWFLLEHGNEALLVATTLSENLAEVLPLHLVYVDDEKAAAPPERVPGSVPLVGFRGRDVQRLPAGRYRFQLRIFGMSGYRPGAEVRVLGQLERGLTADVTAQSGPAGPPAGGR